MTRAIHIIGAGNIGFSLGFLLSQKGHDVILTGREPIENIIKSGKLTIKKDSKLINVGLRDNLKYESCPNVKSDSIVLVSTKIYDTKKCLSEYSDILKSRRIIFIQNGLSPESVFFQYLKENRLEYNGKCYGGVVFGTANLDEYGVLESKLSKIVIGSTDNSLYKNNVLDISEEISLPCIHYSSSSYEYQKERATKLIFNSTNLLCFLFNMNLGEMAQNNVVTNLFKERIGEMVTFFSNYNIKLDAKELYNKCLTLCNGKFRTHIPSILQDTYKLRTKNCQLKTEIDQIDRSIINVSKIPMPICKYLLSEAELMIVNINQAEDKLSMYLKLSEQNRQKYEVLI
ncbi:hypothetical protein COX58_00555 [archaeon CG_4_10_14_0_2_um_filter_Archaea_38_6]|nr:MAG: hypothetical protein COS64_03280 [archaeon CG06_land_8_20_14_3_00_37_11]PJA23006.1 MAG: hypothetical protein COX58_00555 [archaeon CG_4_10_14_0_2_um_filter_Archaea_38_6]